MRSGLQQYTIHLSCILSRNKDAKFTGSFAHHASAHRTTSTVRSTRDDVTWLVLITGVALHKCAHWRMCCKLGVPHACVTSSLAHCNWDQCIICPPWILSGNLSANYTAFLALWKCTVNSNYSGVVKRMYRWRDAHYNSANCGFYWSLLFGNMPGNTTVTFPPTTFATSALWGKVQLLINVKRHWSLQERQCRIRVVMSKWTGNPYCGMAAPVLIARSARRHRFTPTWWLQLRGETICAIGAKRHIASVGSFANVSGTLINKLWCDETRAVDGGVSQTETVCIIMSYHLLWSIPTTSLREAITVVAVRAFVVTLAVSDGNGTFRCSKIAPFRNFPHENALLAHVLHEQCIYRMHHRHQQCSLQCQCLKVVYNAEHLHIWRG